MVLALALASAPMKSVPQHLLGWTYSFLLCPEGGFEGTTGSDWRCTVSDPDWMQFLALDWGTGTDRY